MHNTEYTDIYDYLELLVDDMGMSEDEAHAELDSFLNDLAVCNR